MDNNYSNDNDFNSNYKPEIQPQFVPVPGNTEVNYTSSHRPKRKSRIFPVLAAVLITSVISTASVGGFLYYKFSTELDSRLAGNYTDTGSNNTGSPVSFTPAAPLAKGSSIAQIAKAVGPSIVGIRMTVASSYNYYNWDQGNEVSEGSGIIYNKNGYIITNYHVVESADPKSGNSQNTTLEVFLPDKRQAKATFIGGDQKTDLAVIKISLSNLQPAQLGDSSALQVGDLAVAIGNPLGMDFAGSVTSGVISALNRTVDESDAVTLNVLQTDAAINPGNSGGALLNSQGQVVGINTIKISETGVEGLGFAIPINDAKPIVEQLIKYGYVKGRPYLGITGQEISDIIAQSYNIPTGIYVNDVALASGAYNAGIQQGDIILSLDGKKVNTLKELDNIVKEHKVGDTVNIVIQRNGSDHTFKLTFSEER